MAINPETQYPGKINPSDADYPYGSARNITTPGDGTGTPWEAALVNDLFGFQQALLTAAAIVPSGSPEKVGASQYLQALSATSGRRVALTVGIATAKLTNVDFVYTSGYAALGDRGAAAFFYTGNTLPGNAGNPIGAAGLLYDVDGREYQIMGPVLRPEMFGAKGDDLADDYTPIDNSFQASIALGFTVRGYPDAVYRHGTRFKLNSSYSNLVFFANRCTFKPADNSVNASIYIPQVGDGDANEAPADNVTIEHLKTAGSLGAANGIGVHIYGGENHRIISPRNAGWGLSGMVIRNIVGLSVSGYFEDYYGTGNGNHGLAVATLEVEASRLQFNGVRCHANGLGMDFSTGSATVTGLQCWDNTNGGAKLAGSDEQTVIISDFDLSNNGGGVANGIYTNGTFKLLEMSNGRLNNNGADGLDLAHDGVVKFSNVEIDGNGSQGIEQAAGRLEGTNVSTNNNGGKGHLFSGGSCQLVNYTSKLNGAEGADIANGDYKLTTFTIEDNGQSAPAIGLRIRPGAGNGKRIIIGHGVIEDTGGATQTTAYNINGNGDKVSLSMIRYNQAAIDSGVGTVLTDVATL